MAWHYLALKYGLTPDLLAPLLPLLLHALQANPTVLRKKVFLPRGKAETGIRRVAARDHFVGRHSSSGPVKSVSNQARSKSQLKVLFRVSANQFFLENCSGVQFGGIRLSPDGFHLYSRGHAMSLEHVQLMPLHSQPPAPPPPPPEKRSNLRGVVSHFRRHMAAIEVELLQPCQLSCCRVAAASAAPHQAGTSQPFRRRRHQHQRCIYLDHRSSRRGDKYARHANKTGPP